MAIKILINGGGIAGNALALLLSRAGHTVTVTEHFPRLRTGGLQLDLRGQGIEAMRRMGIAPQVEAACVPEKGARVVDGSGREWAFFPVNAGSGPESFSSTHEIMRGDLCRIMADGAEAHGARYVFGDSVASWDDRDTGIDVRFSSGGTGTYDLLVGADGQRSRTRRMLDEKDEGLHWMGDSHIAYFTIPREAAPGEPFIATHYMASGGRYIMTRRCNPDVLQVYLCFAGQSDALRGVDRAREKECVADIFSDAGWEAKGLVDAMRGADDFYLERMGFVRTPSWSRGRAALVGDAAWCTSATTGMGTSASMVGAYVLAGEIARHCRTGGARENVQAALAAYDDTFRPFVDLVQSRLKGDDGFSLPHGALGVAAMRVGMWLASKVGYNLFGGHFMGEKLVEAWVLPEYKELMV